MKWDLVTLDLDGTLLPEDTAFAAVLRGAGMEAEVKASDEEFFAGRLSLEDCFWQQWDWVKALPLAAMHRGLRQAQWLPEIAAGVRAIQATGAKVRLLTDQPSVLTDYLGRWGLVDAVCSPVKVVEGMAVEVDAQFDKWANLERVLHAERIDPARVCHVGNGANDVPVWSHVGGSVAVFAPDEVAAKADVSLTPTSLVDVAAAIDRM